MPAATEATTEPSGRNKIGVLLRETRQSFGGDINEIAATLRIRPAYLTAIEEAQFDRLPAPVYAIGFVRAYANHLGLDGEEAVRRFKQETTNFESPRGLSFPVPLGERSIPGGTVVLAALILAVCGYGLWYYVSTGERSRPERVSAVPPELKPLVANVAPAPAPVAAPAAAPAAAAVTPDANAAAANPPPAPAAVSVSEPPPASVMSSAATNAPAPQAAPPIAASTTDTVAPTPPSAVSPSTSAAPATQVASVTPPSVVTPPEAPAPAAAPTATASAGAAVPAPDQPRVFGAVGLPARIVITARKDNWMQVRDGEQIVAERTLHPGDSYRVPDRPGLVMRTGNGAGLDIEVDGKKVPSLGRAVRRNVLLDPARLAAGTAVSD